MSFLPFPLFPAFSAPSPLQSPIVEVLADDYLLSLVLRSLTRDSFHYALVSTRWYAAARFSLAHLTIKSDIRCSVLLDTIRTFSSLTHLELQSFACPSLAATSRLSSMAVASSATSAPSLSTTSRTCRPPLLCDLRTLHLCRCEGYNGSNANHGVDQLEHLIAPPESIGALQQLQELRVATRSAFKGLPDSIGSLTNLRSLTFTNLFLAHLPTSIGGLPHLQTLEIEMHELESIPDSFHHLTCLRSFSLHSKCLTRVPAHVMGAMLRLKALSLCCESLQSLPDTICCLPLSSLSLSCPKITSLPDSLGALIQLETLKLQNLPKIGYLPESMGELQQLRSLEIDQLGLLRQLPESLCTGSVRHSLEQLYLRDCGELQQLPPQMAMRMRLEELEITWCTLLESLEPLLAPHPPLGVTASLASALSMAPDLAPRPPLDPAPASATVAPTATAAGPTSACRSLGQLENLRVLKLQYMEKLSVLPKSLGQLKNLETLELCYLPELNSLPGSLRWLPKLKEPLLIDVGRVTDRVVVD
ncbi:unnamed protein product [Closterium sp. Naga37s-1]|nr:unnamed protein product [Closterium sp. Naga37s-1]